MANHDVYYLAFSHFLGIGPIRLNQLIAKFGNVKKAYEANCRELESVIGASLSNRFKTFRAKFDPQKKFDELNIKKIAISTWESADYPRLLRQISDPPICLYSRGQFDIAAKPHYMAIVGTRNPTQYGFQIAKEFARRLVEAGFVIVSGLAAGIDGVAHQATLDSKGHTIAVLGCGVDIVYPAINNRLYYQIIEQGGMILSEFPPGQIVQKGLFIARNRIISGLSHGVLIVEGSEKSGSLITARYAAEQGRDVFAPPSPITSKMSLAPNLLLKQGAKMVMSVEDILSEFNLKTPPHKEEPDLFNQLTDEEKDIIHLLLKCPHSADEISLTKKITIEKVLNILTLLEIKGLVIKDKEGQYQVQGNG